MGFQAVFECSAFLEEVDFGAKRRSPQTKQVMGEILQDCHLDFSSTTPSKLQMICVRYYS